MKTILKFLKTYGLTLVLVFTIGTQIVNCNGAATDNIADLIPDDSGGGGGGGGGGGVETDFGSEDDFYIGIVSATNSIAHVRTAGAYGTKCKISKDETASQDLVCIIDSPEGSLFYNGLEMSYNIPKGMCDYVTRTTYWFYNEHSGVGPGNVELYATRIDDTSTVTSAVTTTYSYTCSTGNRIGTSVSDPDCDSTSQEELEIIAGEGSFSTVRCRYDNSATVGGKNCCFGSYRKRTQNFIETRLDGVVTVSATPTGSPTITKQSWGGDYKTCIGGPGKTDWDAYATDYTIPLGKISPSINGVFSTYKINSTHSNIKNEIGRTSVHIANFYNSVSQTHSPAIAGSPTTLPYAVNPIDDVTGSLYNTNSLFVDDTGITSNSTIQGNDAYTFSCLDAAFETKHRIKVYVREWDTYADYLAYIASDGATSVPDNKGTAPLVNCEGLPGPCNDYDDFDDLVNATATGSYAPTTSATVRATYFPRIQYKN